MMATLIMIWAAACILCGCPPTLAPLVDSLYGFNTIILKEYYVIPDARNPFENGLHMELVEVEDNKQHQALHNEAARCAKQVQKLAVEGESRKKQLEEQTSSSGDRLGVGMQLVVINNRIALLETRLAEFEPVDQKLAVALHKM